MQRANLQDKPFSPPLSAAVRRGRLTRLDQMLHILEELNLRERKDIPDNVKEGLTSEGIYFETLTITEIIDRVFSCQEGYMSPDKNRSSKQQSFSFVSPDSIVGGPPVKRPRGRPPKH